MASKFFQIASIFRETFRSLGHMNLDILYPIPSAESLQHPDTSKKTSDVATKEQYILSLPPNTVPKFTKFLFLSINRYERKKQLNLALLSLAYLRDHWHDLMEISQEKLKFSNVHLVVAGGYDDRVSENVEYYIELTNLADSLKIANQVTFLRSCTSEMKSLLIASCDAVIYTPANEHFGIVPVEAMFLSRPVIALNCGGPKETVLHEITGFLCDVDLPGQLPKIMATYLARFISDPELVIKFGNAGRQRVLENFSETAFRRQLQVTISNLIDEKSK